MISLRSACVLAKLPFQLLTVIVHFFLMGRVLHFRRYAYSLPSLLKLVFARAVLLLDIKDTRFLNLSFPTILSFVKFVFPKSVGQLPGYGKKFDETSYWLVEQPNRSKDDLVIIYSHGGGYTLQISPQQVESTIAMYLLLTPEKRAKVSILLFDYKLVSDGFTFPTQMHELHATYGRLAETTSKIALLGDSAGGNLSIGYTQYLKLIGAPASAYPTILAVISPWLNVFPDLSLLPKDSTYWTSSGADVLPFEAFTNPKSRKNVLGEQDPFSLIWSPASKFPPSQDDWSDIPTFNAPERRIFLMMGEDEVFRDEILTWLKYALGLDWDDTYSKETGTSLELESKNLNAYMESWGCHDAFSLFENTLLKAIEKGHVTSPKGLEDEYYFCLRRLASFFESV